MNEIIRQQAEELIRKAIVDQYPEMDLADGTPQYDIYVRPFLTIVAEIVEQNQIAERKRTIANWEDLTDEEADAEAARLMTYRDPGRAAQGSVRVKLSTPQDVTVPAGTAVTIAGNAYEVSEEVSLPANAMPTEPLLGYAMVDLPIVATEVGVTYDVPAGTPAVVDAFAGNPLAFETLVSSPVEGGIDRETNAQLYERARKGQVVRNLVNVPSIKTVLTEKFPGLISRIEVAGMLDVEMTRDLMTVVDPVVGEVTFHRGVHTDVYVKTPVRRQVVEFELLPNQEFIDLSGYRALLKIHSVKVKGDGAIPFYALVDQDPKLRYSAIDPVRLFVDPGLMGQVVQVDMSYAPDVVTINDWVNSEEVRLSSADTLVRYFHPAWLSATIYVEGGFGLEAVAAQAVAAYTGGLRGADPVVVSKVTEAIHQAGVGSVIQDYEITAEVIMGDGERVEYNAATALVLESRAELGFTPRIATFINEGIVITPIS